MFNVVKNDHFTLCYSNIRLKIISVRTCPDTVFCLLWKVQNVKLTGAWPLDPIEGLTVHASLQLLETSYAPYKSVGLASLTFEIRQALFCMC